MSVPKEDNHNILRSAAASVQARQRIRSYIYQTPLIPAQSVGKSNDTKILFKAENFQITGSFKIRGAMSKMSATSSSATGNGKEKPCVTASSGNHGIGAAYAARALGKELTVVLPEVVVPAKLEKIRSYGVEVVLHGAETGLAERHAQGLAKDGKYVYVSPYNDEDIVAGQGTIGLEILEQCAGEQQVDDVFIAMGGGGLISGIGSVFKAYSPQTKIWGVSAIASRALAASIEAGEVVEVEHAATLADAVAGGIDDDTITLGLAKAVVDELVDCDEDEIKRALRQLAFQEKMIVEGSAALALAGYNKVAQKLKGRTSVIVLCGANVDQKAMLDVINGKEDLAYDIK